MTQHTPAPWVINGEWIDGKDSEPVCQLPTDNLYENYPANARLIAAAPDMLAALESLQRELKQAIRFDVKKHYSLMLADTMATNAINKAKGL